MPEYSNPPKRYFYEPSPGLRILGYSLPKLNHQEVSALMKAFINALVPLVTRFFSDFCLPHASEFLQLGYTPADFGSIDLLPWNEIVRQSYALALIGFNLDLSWEAAKLEEIVHHTLPSQSKGYLEQWLEAFVEVMRNNSHKPMEAIFAGTAPLTNENLKQVAAVGSYYFDLCYYQNAEMYQVQTTKKQLLQVPNDQPVAVYDEMVNSLPSDSPLIDSKSFLLARNWNNKGNSMEAISFMLAELGFHELTWALGWIILNLQFEYQNYSWLSPHIH